MSTPAITAESLTMAYGSFVVMNDLNFKIDPGSICIIMGGSGCGKSTLLKHLIGLKEPAKGEIFYGEESFTKSDSDTRADFLRKIGVTYQSGALFSSLTLAENVAVPLQKELRLKPKKVRDIASYKLALVGLAGFEDFYPAEISGGMRKRASLARAIALDPDLLFFDEPSAGLDPLSSARLDELILQLRDSLGTTVVIVTHELESIFAIADHCLYLDVDDKTLTAQGSPKDLVKNPPNDRVYKFLTRNGQSRT
ncbi:ATP-binding cassette domain-containing protein [Verrucomicrobiales bacterium]|nr:ATP-binding cassette domain-containing protein [Verrucomicrobiales bacterium]